MYNPQLETFLRVADAGSFNKAAEESYITPTAVIKQINLLEESLGVKLFDRSHRGLQLTKAGRSMYQDAKYIIQYCRDSVTRAKNAMQEDENIIRIGSAGAIAEDVHIRDIVIGMGACTNSNYAMQYRLPGTFAPIASYGLLEKAVNAAKVAGVSYKVGNLFSSDTFYDDAGSLGDWRKMGVLAVEMESAALFTVAAARGVRCGSVFHVIWNQERNAAGLYQIRDEDTDAVVRTGVEAIRLLIRRDREKA